MDEITAKARAEFQARLDSAPEGSTLQLSRGELPGPLSITRRLTLEGDGVTIWSMVGPTVSVLADGVVLRNLKIEVTDERGASDSTRDCALMIGPGLGIRLEEVEVCGLVLGLASEEGAWQYPRVVQLGQLIPKNDYQFRLGLVVPVPCEVVSQVSDLDVEPRQLVPGPNEVILRIGGLSPDTLLSGKLVLSSARLKRRIMVVGHVSSNEEASPAGPGRAAESVLWLPPDWWSLTGRPPDTHPSDGRMATGAGDGHAGGPQPLASPASAGAVSQPIREPTVIVSATGGAAFTTIGAAIGAAAPGTRILVRPGTYKESLTIDKPLELVGDGPREQIVIEGAPGLRLQADQARVLNLSVRAVEEGGRRTPAVLIVHGRPILEGCAIHSDALACVVIQGRTADPILRRCTIRDGKAAGLLIHDSGWGLLEECEIAGHAFAGVEIRQGGNPTLRRCQIRDGRQVGVLVHDQGEGTIEECEIAGHALAGVEIRQGGNPSLRLCQIRDGQGPGVLVHADGRGTLLGCEVTRNARAGVEVRHRGAPTLQQCRIHHGQQTGLLFAEDAAGTVEDCVISANALAGIEIRQRANPRIRRCKVHDGQQAGVAVHHGGEGMLEDSELFDNVRSGLEIWLDGNPLVRRCKIKNGRRAGVLVARQGRGKLEDCEIAGNAWSGVIIADLGQLEIRGSEIHGGKHAGIAVCRQGTATVEDCWIHEYALAGVAITQGGRPNLQKCRITQNGDVAVWAFAKAGGQVLDCILTGNARGAFEVTASRALVCRGNTT